jgi:hypothetical protein
MELFAIIKRFPTFLLVLTSLLEAAWRREID